MQLIKLYIQILKTLNVENVERANMLTPADKAAGVRIKEGVRKYAIQNIVHIFGAIVLQNYESFQEQDVKDSLLILAQLIDWNDLV